MALSPGVHILLYEGSGASPLGPDRRYGILSGLLDLGYSVSRTGTGDVSHRTRIRSSCSVILAARLRCLKMLAAKCRSPRRISPVWMRQRFPPWWKARAERRQ